MRGIVLLPDGKTARDVRVVPLESPEHAMTDSLGRFVLHTTYRGLAARVARRIAFVPASIRFMGSESMRVRSEAESVRVGGL